MDLQLQGAKAKIKVSDAVFGQDFKEALVHQVVTACMAADRSGNSQQKNRALVSGGGIKPWRQKGTGRARAGTIRSPLWRGGGKVFASVPRSYAQKVNRKMYRSAMRSILSELLRQDRLLTIEAFDVAAPKTRELAGKLKDMGLDNVLIITDMADDRLYLAARNLPRVAVCDVTDADPVSLIGFDKILITTGALKQLEERLA